MAMVRDLEAYKEILFSEARKAWSPDTMRALASAGAGFAPVRSASAIWVVPLFASSSESWASRMLRALPTSLLHKGYYWVSFVFGVELEPTWC